MWLVRKRKQRELVGGVEFPQNPRKYKALGARIPKGVFMKVLQGQVKSSC